MNKTWLIIKREYASRVRKKTFILTTLLTPLLFVGVIGFIIFITVKNVRNEKIAVVDPNGTFQSSLENSKSVTYDFRPDVDTGNFVEKGYSALLLAPHTGINQTNNLQLITQKSLSRFASSKVDKDVSRALENNMISHELKIDPKRIDSIKNKAEQIHIDPYKKSELARGTRNNFDVASAVGYVTAFLIYITLIIYGMMVMRGVMEEKTNRIAEVMVSSVKPFQMMLGKIIGIGAVGLTQFLMWIVLIFLFTSVASAFIPHDMLEQIKTANENMPGSSQQTSEAVQNLARAQASLSTVHWPLVVGCFIFYFLGGFLFYASLFAAVGSAVNEDAQDAQSLAVPITMPIIIGIFLMLNSINDPISPMATWSSIIPFFSPIVMMSRIPFGVPDIVPYWQLGLSMVLLVLGFLATTWLSARIYRTGILLYGKKPSLKEMIRWIRQ
jgi:ABC-2 type transport system permease protein